MKMPLLGALSLSLLLTGCAALNNGPRRALPVNSSYVSMGSSFAAGAGIGPMQAGSPERCNRTVNNYASLIATRLQLNLVDVSCGGASTDHILGNWNELPPQIDTVNVDTRLVTITIGGNDLGYVGWLFSSSCRHGVSAIPGPCRQATEPTEMAYQRLDQNLREIASQIRKRAPKARIVFIQYVTLISKKPCALETLTPQDAVVGKRIADRLSDITRKAALASGGIVLDADRVSLTHTPCSVTPWSNGLSKNYDKAKGAPWHPNAAGHAAIADMLLKIN
jgi:lysophospholipase L1-like esterase